MEQFFFECGVVVGLETSATVFAEVFSRNLVAGQPVKNLHHRRQGDRVGSLGLLVLLGEVGGVAGSASVITQ